MTDSERMRVAVADLERTMEETHRVRTIDERVAASTRDTVRVRPLTCQEEFEAGRRVARMEAVWAKHLRGELVTLESFLAVRGI
jgi:hypothetical protein